MIGREFRKRVRLRHGRSETITTRYELDTAGHLIEHVTLETNERRTGTLDMPQVYLWADRRRTSGRSGGL